jgi:hypothetical protein
MDCDVAQITNDNEIVVFIFKLKAHIALHIIIVIIFWDFHFKEWIKSVLFFLLESSLLFQGNVFVNRKSCLIVALDKLRLDHKISIKVIQVVLV